MIKVLIVEDMHLLRTALAMLLHQEPDIEVCAAVSYGEEAVATATRHRPDVAVLDIGLPRLDGFGVADALRAAVPSCRSLMLTSVPRPGDLRRTLSVGAAGLLAKDAEPAVLADAIRTVAAGQPVVDPDLAISTLRDQGPALTRRELDTLALLAEGEELAAIAKRLFLSRGTVRNYLASAVAKLGARNRVDAIRIARQQGLI
jgi:two-component system response regulator DesR